MANEFVIGTGRSFAVLANEVSDAVHRALVRGMEVDEAVSCAATVLADYARSKYGDDYLAGLASIIQKRRGQPLPKNISS